MSFSKHANNIYVMGKDYIQKINDTKIYAEKMYYRNFIDQGKQFVCIIIIIVICMLMVIKN